MHYLCHVSELKLEELRGDVRSNLDRYLGGGFADLARDPGWGVALDVEVDPDVFAELNGQDRSAAADLFNSKILYGALKNLTPSLANEERIWVRLSHVDAFEYCRHRWLHGGEHVDSTVGSIERHFFGRTQTGIRDDHALSRLWWNGYIAQQCYPHDVGRGLELLLATADVRSNLVERVWLTGRRRLATALFQHMERDSFVLSSERAFRDFMKAINLLGAGIVFEAMSSGAIGDFLARCSEHAQRARSAPNPPLESA